MSQNDQILNHLKSGKKLTAIHALQFYGCARLAARILNLREKGHDIKTTIVHKGKKHWAVYSMEAGK